MHGQLLSVNRSKFKVFLHLEGLLYHRSIIQSDLQFTHRWREDRWIYTFPKGINAIRNVGFELESECSIPRTVTIKRKLSLSLSIYIYIYIYVNVNAFLRVCE